eukprot:NODE_110_length_2503_cov_59.666667_g100_i0.p1 GENE.NODE_110_length_2503_cov_59.666667_g100_i0~~NODE_110_length_2503_cov_59.666667_g100_i0.p1  ORF type:complete len:369 (+),score=80.73 NODE_110_length_2503_cov_59.666667_g100_i0:33-1139(+)
MGSCKSHSLDIAYKDFSRIALETKRGPRCDEVDFEVSFVGTTPGIVATVLLETTESDLEPVKGFNTPDSADPSKRQSAGLPDEGGAFALFLSPPSELHKYPPPFGRNIVFMLDKSGSMRGEPIEAAKKAILVGMDLLQPAKDKFMVFAYDSGHYVSTNDLVVATPENVQAVSGWISGFQAGGGTNICVPLEVALGKLQADPTPRTIPYIFLITDGAVQDERDICRMVHQKNEETNLVRITTFGIGPYCNGYFLKRLASTGRGYSSTSLQCDSIYEKMVRLISMADKPILTNISMDIENVTEVEIYPFPIPDLFCGGPIVISGRYAPPNYLKINLKINFLHHTPHTTHHTPHHTPHIMEMGGGQERRVL